jgi:DNA-binding transcriptional ArsR family regulator
MTSRSLPALPKIVTLEFRMEPIFTILDTFESLAMHGDHQGMAAWVQHTVNDMPAELMRIHSMVYATFVLPMLKSLALPSHDNFSRFIDDIAGRDPTALRDDCLTLLSQLFAKTARINKAEPGPTAAELLDDPLVYLRWMELTFADKHHARFVTTDEPALLAEPTRFLATVVSHLRKMWALYIEDEWQRNRALLEECVAAYRQLSFSGLTALEAIRAVTGRDVSGIHIWDFSATEHLIFIPSAHLGPYLDQTAHGNVARIVFGARLPKGIAGTAALTRSELLVRLNALADETRLRILELLAREGELCAQDLIERIGLGQSSVSRHLSQLSATGYIVERRREVNKCYTLNRDRIDDTLLAIKQLLKP